MTFPREYGNRVDAVVIQSPGYVEMTGRNGKPRGQRWRSQILWTCAHYPQCQNQDKKILDRTDRALRSSRVLLENAEKLLGYSRIASEIVERERKNFTPPPAKQARPLETVDRSAAIVLRIIQPLR